MNPIRAAVDRPYTVAVVVILTLLFSVLALRRIPIQLKPTVDTPRISVSTNFRGAGAVEVEEQLTRELEDVLQSVEGLVEMTSESSEGRSSITLEYDFGTDTQLAVVDVINKLSQVSRLPAEADEPEVDIANTGGPDAVMWIAIRSRYEPDYVGRLVEENVEARLERVKGVSQLLVVGRAEREIQVRLDPQALVAHGVTVQQVLNAVSRGNQNLRGGTVETDGRQIVVRTVGRAVLPAELERRIVAEAPGGAVYLGQVAQVVDAYRERTGFVNLSGKPGVAIGVLRQAGSNVVSLIEEVDEAIEELNATFASRGLDVWLEPVYRETTYIEAALAFVTDNLLLGAGLAVIVLLVFLRSVRSVLVVSLSIPVSLVTVFLVMSAAGRTLNVISLAGIAFAAGMVVDNAVVVLENVFRHMEQGKRPCEAVVAGGSEVWGGVLASSLTTIAVFVPIIIGEDETTQLFTDLALAISAAVGLSLVVALTVVPVLIALLYREGREGTTGETERLGFLGRAYGRFVDRLRARTPGAVAAKLGFVLLLVAGSLASVRLMPEAEYLPTGNRNLVLFFAAPIPGTKVESIRENLVPFEQFILAQPEVQQMFSVVGPFFNGGGVILKDEHADGAGLADFHRRLFMPAAMLAGFRFVVPIRASLFQDPGKQFEVELSGPDFAALERASQQLQGRLMAVPGVQFVRSSLVTGRPEAQVTIDEERAKDLGLDVAEVGTVIETLIAGRRSSALIDAGREVEINVLAPPDKVDSAEQLGATTFLTRDGQPVALSSVAHVERTTGPQSIRRLERERNVLLTVNIAEAAPLEGVLQDVERDVFPAMSAELGPAFTLAVGGSADKLRTTLTALTSGFGLSLLIVYLLLVSLFRSWTTPAVILVTVPLALSGGLIGIRVASELSGGAAGFDVISMLGFVILAGLVVNNAILIVHQANNFRREGLDPDDALAASARTRLRPILMTVITTVSAMIPLALGGGAGAELYQGLGAVIVGGLIVSTLFTLFLVPVLLSLGIDLRESVRRERRAPGTVTAETA